MLQLLHRLELVRGPLRPRTHPSLDICNRGELEDEPLEQNDSKSDHKKHECLLEFIDPSCRRSSDPSRYWGLANGGRRG